MGMPDPESRLAKAELARFVRQLLREEGLDLIAVAQRAGTSVTHLTELVRGRLAGWDEPTLRRLRDILQR